MSIGILEILRNFFIISISLTIIVHHFFTYSVNNRTFLLTSTELRNEISKSKLLKKFSYEKNTTRPYRYEKTIEPPRHKGHKGISQRALLYFIVFSLVCRISGMVSWWFEKLILSDIVRKTLRVR